MRLTMILSTVMISRSAAPPIKPTFSTKKRSAQEPAQSQIIKRLRIEAYEHEIATLLEKNSQLGKTKNEALL